MKEKVFDSHIHVYPEKIASKAVSNLENFYHISCEGRGTLSDLLLSEEKAGVSGLLFLGVATQLEQVENVNLYLQAAKQEAIHRGFDAYAFAGYHQDITNPEKMVQKIIENGFSGIKIHPDLQNIAIDDLRLWNLYCQAEGKLPICFHMGDIQNRSDLSSPERLVRVLKEFPNLTVIAAHMGGVFCWEKVVEIYKGQQNLFFDCSSTLEFMDAPKATDLIRKIGTKRIFFGTDYPICQAEQVLSHFHLLNLTKSEKEDILWNNVHRLLT
jgi:hypothetical protein